MYVKSVKGIQIADINDPNGHFGFLAMRSIFENFLDKEVHFCANLFHWVKAHCGIPGNTSADEYAKEAAISNYEITFNKIPISYFKKTIKENTKHGWNQRYQNSHTGE